MDQCFQLDIQQLPQSWIHHFIGLLPNHLMLALRQCSCSMLKLVDSHPSSCLTWQVTPAAQNVTDQWATGISACLALCAANVVHLDISQLSNLDQAKFCAAVAEGAEQHSAKQVFSRLKKLTVRLDQHLELAALAANITASSLQQLLIWCCHSCATFVPSGEPRLYDPPAEHLLQIAATLSNRHLVSVRQLTLLGVHHSIGAIPSSTDDEPWLENQPSPEYSQYFCERWLQKLTNLQSLHCQCLHDMDPDLFLKGLTLCLQPLQHLTHLDLTGVEGGVDFHWAEAADLPEPKPLQSLSLNTLHACDITTEAVLALAQRSSLTRLQLTGGLAMFDLQVLSSLANLQDLSLFSDLPFRSDGFEPLTACRSLTSLSTDSFLLYPTSTSPTVSTAAGAGVGAAVTGAADAVAHAANSSQLGSADEATAVAATEILTPTQGATSSASQHARAAARTVKRPWCLPSLKRLSVGNVGLAECLAPLSTFAPSLTELQDTYWDEFDCKPIAGRGAAEIDALGGLQHLQVLDLDLYTLDRHARHLGGLTGLSTLHELRVEMVGDSFQESGNLQDGLPQMPYLTKLLMYTKEDVLAENWVSRYNCSEDLLLWQNQAQLRVLAIRGSCRVGGFLVDADICAQLPEKLPVLRCVHIEQCPDVVASMLVQLVAVCPAPLVKVVGCKPVTDRECCKASSVWVTVEYM